MLAQFYDVPDSGDPTEIVPEVDADYEVLLGFTAAVNIGGPDMTGNGFGDGGFRFQNPGTQTLRLKPGDSLYAIGVSSGVEVSVFAQPC